MKLFGSGTESLPSEGRLADFDGAAGWLNTEPLTKEGLRGNVVLVDFWTYTCINWLRTLAWVRAWADKYADEGLVVVGVHTPEFPFERDVDNVRRAVEAMDVRYPVALDPEYAVWDTFANRYWPAAYIADREGTIRHHQFGEGGYEEQERVIQRLLGVDGDLVSVEPAGFEAQADWEQLKSPETYLGSQQGTSQAPPGDLTLNEWSLEGDWRVEPRAAVLADGAGRLSFRFHARHVHLVMGPRERGAEVPFRVLLDGEAPADAHGLDAGEDGRGTLSEQRLHQLIRQPGRIEDRTLELDFPEGGVEAYCFTFG
jgi:thiol-disulfide isomerase/thioredoxin